MNASASEFLNEVQKARDIHLRQNEKIQELEKEIASLNPLRGEIERVQRERDEAVRRQRAAENHAQFVQRKAEEAERKVYAAEDELERIKARAKELLNVPEDLNALLTEIAT
jgi:chromosome segregation ATPase